MNFDFTPLTALRDEWRAAQPLRPEDEARLWKKLRLEWNYHSNHIEGNTLTYGETELLLLHDRTTGNHTLREYEEMKAHDVAIDHVRAVAAEPDRPLSEADIRELNRILLKEPFWKEAITPDGQPTRKQVIPGQYKTTPNQVRTATGAIFSYASVEDTPPRMQSLAAWLRGELESPTVHPVATAARVHHDFVAIHPFDDGNGRVARLLVNYVLMRHGYLPVIVPTKEKNEYLTVLGLADAGDLAPFTSFLARVAEASLRLGLRAARGESIAEPDDLDKELAIFIRNERNSPERWARLSPEVLRQLFDQGLETLVNRVISRVEQVAPLFASHFVLIKPHEAGSTRDVREALPLLIAQRNRKKVLSVDFAFSAYTGKAPRPFGLTTEFQVEFGQYEYRIKAGTRTDLKKRYQDPILAEEIEAISSSLLAEAFDRIKELSGSGQTNGEPA